MTRPNAVSRSIRASSLLVLAIAAAGCKDSPTGPAPTAIDWNARGNEFPAENNARLAFSCPASGIAYTVWGTDVYTDDSSICTAAVHAGAITRADGGNVTIEIRPGQSSYGATTRNGITSRSYDEWPRSFIVR